MTAVLEPVTRSVPTPLPGGGTAFDLEVRVKAVVAVTHDVSTFVLEPPEPRAFSFAPGQYLVLSVTVDGRRLQRCYTISSPPTRPHLLTITVKRTPGGPVSTHLHDQVRVGSRVHVSGPYGEFSLAGYPSDRYLLLSAGSGITPMLSMTRTLADLAESADVAFVHSARTPADLICRTELEALAAGGLTLRLSAICEGIDPGQVWVGPRGRLGAPLLQALVPDVAQREVFLCGPPPYMAAMSAALHELGVPPQRCHLESFTLPEAAPVAATAATAVAPVATRSVEFRRSGRTVPCPEGTTVLQAAVAAGVPLRSACGQGLCGTCKSDLLSGDVDIRHAGGIRPREVAAGKFLPCCSYPLGDVVVDA